MSLQLKGNTNDARLHIATAIAEGTARVVSDGSYLEEKELGTASFVLESQQQNGKIIGTIVTPGTRSDILSYRAELSGILATIRFVNALCQEFQVNTGAVLLGCDSLGALDSIHFHQEWQIVKSKEKHFDVLTSILHSLKHSNIKWKLKHVKGHQDDHLTYHKLNRLAQLNAQTDKYAKKRLSSEVSHLNEARSLHLPYDHCMITWTDQEGVTHRVSNNLTKTLHTFISQRRLRDYWIHKQKFPASFEKHLDWPVIHKSFKALKVHRHQQVSKWLTGFCGVGKMLVRYNYQSHSKCPRCNKDNESVSHVIQCPSITAQATWDTEIRKLHTWLEENDCEPNLAEIILENLKA